MSDTIVWEIINHGHCSYKAKMVKQNYCRNEYNVSGLCNRSSCPLSNSRYATIREDKGRVYLYIKTIERAHTPRKLWQRIRLSRKYMTALQQVDEHLAFWPKFLVHKNKQRLTKITQYLIRMRKLALKPQKKIVAQPARLKKMEKRKEAKAEKAADIETAIETELMERLKSGTYGDIYNFPLAQYHKALDGSEAVPDEQAIEAEGAADGEEQSEEESDAEEQMEYVEDLEESDEEDMEDIAVRLGQFDGDGDSAEGSDDGNESGDVSDGTNASDGEDIGGEGGVGATKRQRVMGAGPSSRQGKAVKRRPRRDTGGAQKRGRGMELEVEQEHEIEHGLNR